MSALDTLSDSDRRRLSRQDFPAWSYPMLATLTDEHLSDDRWIYERKFDGERILAFCGHDRIALMTRNRKSANDSDPEIVAALSAAGDIDCVLDGEIVAFDGNLTSFSRLQQRMQKRGGEARRSGIAIYYYLFDIVHFDNFGLEPLTLRSRKKVLRKSFRYKDPLRLTAYRNGDGGHFLMEACEKGWEGLIADAPYRNSRSTEWLKFKCSRGQELVIGSITTPHGSRKGFGALLVGHYDKGKLRYSGRVGTGFDDLTLLTLRERFEDLRRTSSPFAEDVREADVTWLEPRLIGEFGFTEWTRDRQAPTSPLSRVKT